MPCAGRLLGEPPSTTTTRRRARPSTSAALSPAAPPPTTTTSYRSLSMAGTLPKSARGRHFRCCFRERSVALARGARVGYPGRSRPSRPAPEAPPHPPWHHLDQRRGADRHLEEHAL